MLAAAAAAQNNNKQRERRRWHITNEIFRASKTNFILSTIRWALNMKNKHSHYKMCNTCFLVFFLFFLFLCVFEGVFFIFSLPHFDWPIEFCSNFEYCCVVVISLWSLLTFLKSACVIVCHSIHRFLESYLKFLVEFSFCFRFFLVNVSFPIFAITQNIINLNAHKYVYEKNTLSTLRCAQAGKSIHWIDIVTSHIN